MIDKLLLEPVGLPHVLVLAVHLVNFFSWVSQGGHSEQLLFFALYYQSTPSCLKVIGWVCVGSHVVMCRRPCGGVGGPVAHVIIVSAQGPNPSFFLIWGDFYSTWGPVGTWSWSRSIPGQFPGHSKSFK